MSLERATAGRSAALRTRIQAKSAMVVPGVANALSACVVQDLGFEALYLSGAGITNMNLGMPDLGFITLDDLSKQTGAIRDCVDLPIIVDCDTGFGNAVNVYHTVRRLERAGANALQFEDQAMPKRCGHFTGTIVVSADEMIGKIKAATDARQDDDLLIIARTDARATEGFEAAVDRAAAYTEAGADIIFLEAPESVDEIRAIPSRLSAPQMINMVVGGRTPVIEQSDLAEMGYGMVLYANVALQGAVLGMQRALEVLRDSGRMHQDESLLVPFSERQRLVSKPFFDELERQYGRK